MVDVNAKAIHDSVKLTQLKVTGDPQVQLFWTLHGPIDKKCIKLSCVKPSRTWDPTTFKNVKKNPNSRKYRCINLEFEDSLALSVFKWS